MSRHNVGEESDHQRERLRDHSEELDRLHNRYRKFKEHRHVRPKYLLPIMFVTEKVYRKECEQRKHHCHGYVSGHIRSSREERHQSEKVGQEDEEEGRKEIRSVFLVVLLADRRLDDVVVHHHNHHLHKAGESAWSLVGRIVLPIPPRHTQDNEYQEYSSNHQGCDILCYRDVERPFFLTVRTDFHDLVGIAPFLGDVKSFIVMAVLECRGHKHVPACAAVDDARERNGDVLSFPVGYMPSVAVRGVAEKDFGDVDFRFRHACVRGIVVCGADDRCRHRENHGRQKSYVLKPPHSSAQTVTLLYAISTNPDLMSTFSSTPALVNAMRPSSSDEISGAWSFRTIKRPFVPGRETLHTIFSRMVRSGEYIMRSMLSIG